MEQGAIASDIRWAEGKLSAISNEISALLALPLEATTPQSDARRLHLNMLQAHELCRIETAPAELKTFYAAYGAGHITTEAERVAADKATCAELSSRMNDIRRREGLKEDEFWLMQNEGPEDYQELSHAYGEVLGKINETIFPFVLRRYCMAELADLFEKDHATFDIQREIGRRLVFHSGEHSDEVNKVMDNYFLKDYGEAVVQSIHSRVSKLRGPMPEE